MALLAHPRRLQGRRVLASLALVLTVLAASRAGAAELISIQGLSIAADEYVAGFNLVTDGIDVLAVCHVLPDWTFEVYNGRFPPDSHISGDAHHGASSLPATALDRLKRLFLVQQDPAADDGHGPSISGVLQLGSYDTGIYRKLALTPANIVWEPSEACR